MTKSKLRKSILSHRNQLSSEDVQSASIAVSNQLKHLFSTTPIQTIHTYLPIQNEIDPTPFLKYALSQGATLVVSKTLKNRELKHLILESFEHLVEGKFGTQYPKNEKEYHGAYDLILVPAIAYDKQNNRLGYGAGYYDTFLKDHPEALKIGLAYTFQLLEEIPTEAHDVPLDKIIRV